jgi:hypothetical protein
MQVWVVMAVRAAEALLTLQPASLTKLHKCLCSCTLHCIFLTFPCHAGLGGDGSEGGWEMEDLELPADLGLDTAATAAAAAGAPFVAPTPGEFVAGI